jgi:hypothetical protein
MVLWQPNPSNAEGQLVPTAWDAGSQTGFTPSSSLNATQLGFQNKPGTSTAQMDGDTVGAYLNSANLPGAPVGQKMMIAPRFAFSPESAPYPFSSTTSVLSGSMDLQIPTAVGAETYVLADMLFQDENGVQISYGVAVFHNAARNPTVDSNYNPPSNSYQLNSPLGVDQRFVTKTSGSAAWTGTSWAGFQTFAWSISRPQFVAALNFLAAEFPGKVQTTDPAKWALVEVHLNAEFHFQPAPAELGWSMRGWKIWETH